jgi:hypothetical protein
MNLLVCSIVVSVIDIFYWVQCNFAVYYLFKLHESSFNHVMRDKYENVFNFFFMIRLEIMHIIWLPILLSHPLQTSPFSCES